jgi:hypothetical protein
MATLTDTELEISLLNRSRVLRFREKEEIAKNRPF